MERRDGVDVAKCERWRQKKKGTKIKKEKESVGHFFLRRCNTGVADRIEEKRRFFNRQFVAIVMVSINYRFSSFKKSILRTRGGRVSFSEVFDSRSIAFMKKKCNSFQMVITKLITDWCWW